METLNNQVQDKKKQAMCFSISGAFLVLLLYILETTGDKMVDFPLTDIKFVMYCLVMVLPVVACMKLLSALNILDAKIKKDNPSTDSSSKKVEKKYSWKNILIYSILFHCYVQFIKYTVEIFKIEVHFLIVIAFAFLSWVVLEKMMKINPGIK